jgi:hypothetical protein
LKKENTRLVKKNLKAFLMDLKSLKIKLLLLKSFFDLKTLVSQTQYQTGSKSV